ncbi:unnamed protein product [Calicophoron daubneyi]|uniref:HMG box domain-containing protein n=1 Tax=Calicophoron daubneyi TaxID=300641 RepID=A0AAV2TN89_CALDB
MRSVPHDKNAPRRPPTAFMLFVKDRRAASEHLASLPFGERNRLLGNEWSVLPEDKRAEYVKQSAEQRSAYKKQMTEYKASDAYKTWLNTVAKNAENEPRAGGKGRKRREIQSEGPATPDCKISIFTHEFLEYNKLREVILRQLKKQAVQLEEETALLSKHVDNLVNAEHRTKQQIDTLKKSVHDEEQLLQTFYKELVASLHEIALPYGTFPESSTKSFEHITETSVHAFVSQLENLSHSETHSELVAVAIQSIRSAITKKTLKLLTL